MVSPETLRRLGFQPGRIVETVVASYTGEGEPHAAPMGVHLEGWDRLVVRPYVRSQTYRNLEARGQCTVNLTRRPEIFLLTAFKGEPEVGKLTKSFFLKASRVEAPRLKEAEGWLEVEFSSREAIGGRGVFKGRIILVKAFHKPPQAYCRAEFAAIESIIHATRVLEFSRAGRRAEADRLARLIASYKALVGRVAPGSEAEKTMGKLSSILSRYGFNLQAYERLF